MRRRRSGSGSGSGSGSIGICAIVAVALLAGPARADLGEDSDPSDASAGNGSAGTPAGVRDVLATQIANETTILDRTIATVRAKLHDADVVRVRRLRAAYRILHAALPAEATAEDRMTAARRRAAARWLATHDAAERGLLAQETSRLEAAKTEIAAEPAQITSLTLPTDLAWPAHGEIARKFGTMIHERSKATLSRRGLDLEVEAHAAASAPADGTVRYAGPIRGLDQGVVLDHGDYFTIVAKLDTPSIPVGAHVTRGDRLGHAARHRVYLELRVKVGPGGLPIDPEPLLHHDP